MKKLALIAGAAMLTAGGAATAQEAQAPDTGAMQSQESFTDAQVESFAAAAVEIQQLQSEPAMDQATMRERAGEIVANSGLDPQTFNAIGQAMQTDPELAERVQMAAAEMMPQGG